MTIHLINFSSAYQQNNVIILFFKIQTASNYKLLDLLKYIRLLAAALTTVHLPAPLVLTIYGRCRPPLPPKAERQIIVCRLLVSSPTPLWTILSPLHPHQHNLFGSVPFYEHTRVLAIHVKSYLLYQSLTEVFIP